MAAQTTTKTTKADFELFKREVHKWINRFSLGDHFLHIRHRNLDGVVGNLYYSYKDRRATITLSTTINRTDKVEVSELVKKTAFHEVTELLLIRLNCLAGDRTFDPTELDAETHSIIARLENYLRPESE